MDKEEWEGLRERFLNHFQGGEASGKELNYASSGSKLLITRSGTVEAEMPLHSFRIEGFESISFEEGLVRVSGEDVEYVFRR